MFKLFRNLMDKNDNHDGLKLNATAIALLGVFFGAVMVATIHCIFNSCKYSANTRLSRPPNTRNGRGRTAAVVTSESTATVAVPVSRYSKECNEEMCSVCLSEFKEGEEIRVLPECLHVFHVDCIDMWLISHSNCPLCRAATASVSVAPQQNHDVVLRIETDHD